MTNDRPTPPPSISSGQDESPSPGLTRPSLSLLQAAQATGLSKSQIRRALDAGRFPGAHRATTQIGQTRLWMIPVDDLIREGFVLSALGESRDRVAEPSEPVREPGNDSDITATVHRLTTALEVEKATAQRWAAIADERAKSLDDLRAAMRMLNAGPADQSSQRPKAQTRVIAFTAALIACGLLILILATAGVVHLH